MDAVDAILAAAEAQAGLVSMAQERAANGDWLVPETLADLLFWWEDEQELQRDQATLCPEEAEERVPYADILHHYAALLRRAGVTPSCPICYGLVLNHLLQRLDALSARFQSGEDLERIFDGNDLFSEVAEEVRLLNRGRCPD